MKKDTDTALVTKQCSKDEEIESKNFLMVFRNQMTGLSRVIYRKNTTANKVLPKRK